MRPRPAFPATSPAHHSARPITPSHHRCLETIGTYTVTCKGVGGGALFAGSGSLGAGGHVQVTAYGGEDADQCKVLNWTTGGADFSANVRCYNHAGAHSDNRFDLLFVW